MAEYRFLYTIPPLLTVMLLVVMLAMTMIRSKKSPANTMFCILCLLASFLYIDIIVIFNVDAAETALRSSRLGHMFHILLIPVYIHFFHAYLKISRRWLLVVAYGYALVMLPFTQTGLMIASMKPFAFGYFGQAGRLYPLMAGGAAFATAYNLIILYRAIRNERRSILKNKLKYVFAGFGTMGVLSSMNFLPMFGYPVYPLGNFSFIPLVVFAAGIFQYDLLDMGLLIRKSILYSAITAMLTGLYAVIIIGAQKSFAGLPIADSIVFPVVLFMLITLVFGPLKNRVEKWLDKLFSQNRYDYHQTIKQASQTIASVLDVGQISRLLHDTLILAMGVENGSLFIADRHNNRMNHVATVGRRGHDASEPTLAADSPLVDGLKRHRCAVVKTRLLSRSSHPENRLILKELSRMNGEVALPMFFKDRLNGCIVLGEKRGRQLYSAEDLDLLEALSHQSGLAIENAKAYHALNRLNRTLEQRVEARTRDLQHALAEKERTQEQLIQSESLAALGQLVAGVAHELNNPLATVTSLLQSTVEDLGAWDAVTPPDPDLIDDLKFADKELARAKSIVASLLGLSRQTQTYSEDVDLNLVIKDALRILHNQHKHLPIDISEDLAADLPTLKGNFANLGQVILNIVQNAIQAVSAESGKVMLATRFERSAEQVVFSCVDNGPGIADEIRADVFKPFFTTKPVGQGTGLGLYICHEIIKKHGGQIELAPKDMGTAIVIRLPVSTLSTADP